MTINRFLCAVVFALVFAGHALAAEIPVPPAGHRVTDQSKMLSTADTQRLADRLKVIQDTTGAQIYILTVPTAGDEGIAPFANRVFVAWGVGRKGVDDGLLIVLATADRKVRVEVGRGLEGNIPDITAKRIAADTMGPLLKDGHYFDGLMAGVNALALRIDSKAAAAGVSEAQAASQVATPARTNPIERLKGALRIVVIVVCVGFLLLFVLLILFRNRTGGIGSTGMGGYPSGDASSSSSSSDYSSSSSSNDSSGGGGDSAGGGSDSSY